MDWIEPIVYLAFLSWLDSQSNPSYNPSPFVAQVAWMYQVRWRSADNPSFSVISVGDIALGRSWRENKIQIDNLIIYLSIKITKDGKRSVFGYIETYNMQTLLETRRLFLSPHQATKGSR